MDHNKDRKFQNKFSKNNHFLKRTFQLVISVSTFSLFLCYSTGFSLFPHSFNVYFSTFLFSFFTHTLERKYMFLICNGILAFLAKCSVSSSSSTSSPSDQFVNGGDHAFSTSEFSPMKEPASEDEKEEEVILTVTSAYEEKQELEQEEQERECLLREKEREESEVFKTGPADGVETDQSVVIQQGDDDIGEPEIEAEDAAVGGGSEDIYSTDELNKKIEEFIRKMKEEIRIEAQQQLITVE